MNKEIKAALTVAGVMISLALGATLARKLGYIDADVVQRIVMGSIGLTVAWQGNRAPKVFAPTAAASKVNRVAGWSLATSGLVYAALWIFAPFQTALIGGCGAIIAGMAVTVIYCLTLRPRSQV